MDQGIRIVWYDLPEDKKKDYMNWLHGEYLPSVQARSGILWVAHYEFIKTDKTHQRLSQFVGRPEGADDLPTGSDFAILIGAGSPHVFFKPIFDDLDARDSRTMEMFSHRIGIRTVITTEQARVDGPQIGQRSPSSTPGPIIQLGHFRVRSLEEEFDLSAWYANYRLPIIAQTPGAIAARKLVTVAGWVKHVILYEFVSTEAHHACLKAEANEAFTDGEWTNRVVKYTAHAPGSPSVGKRIWPES